MYTRCPKCSTCFRVTDRHLSIANGKVRCGQCQLVFNAPENAVDDLTQGQPAPQPVNTVPEHPSPVAQNVTPAEKTNVTAKPAGTMQPASTVTASHKTTASAADNIEPKTIPPQTTTVTDVSESSAKKTTSTTPVFKADSTMIADFSTAAMDDVTEINLDSSAKVQNNIYDDADDDDDELFADSYDLNAAIDELTQANDDVINVTENKSPEKIITEDIGAKTPPAKKDNSGGVFQTDSYDATSASSVADIMNEMEGQLSLDISFPAETKENKYSADDEFDFLEMEDDDFSVPVEQNDAAITDNLIEEQADNEIDEEELFDQVDLSDFKDSEAPEKITLNKTANEPAEDEIPFRLRNNIERLTAENQRKSHPLLSFIFIVILLAATFSQVAYFRSHELVKFLPEAQPLLERFCDKLACQYSGPRDTKKIQLVSRDVRLHPKEKKALLISAVMINNANFAQPYPDIHIRLSDISGNVIAERVFHSKTYLGKLSNPFLLMKSKTPVHINFEVVDPGKDAINFEFTFL